MTSRRRRTYLAIVAVTVTAGIAVVMRNGGASDTAVVDPARAAAPTAGAATSSMTVTSITPITSPGAGLESDAQARFGTRYAGVSFGPSPAGGGPRPMTVHLTGTGLPASFEGAAVVSDVLT
jgi:hypothetical protein